MGILRRFWRLGFPSGLELFLNVAAFNLFLLMFQSYGVTEGRRSGHRIQLGYPLVRAR